MAFHKQMALPLLATPVIWITFLFALRRRRKESVRLVPPPGDGWQRVDREKNRDGKPFLDKGEQAEEKAGTKVYEIWTRPTPEETKVLAFDGDKVRKFVACPSCGYLTFTKPFVKTLKRATTRRTGEGERVQECAFCRHKCRSAWWCSLKSPNRREEEAAREEAARAVAAVAAAGVAAAAVPVVAGSCFRQGGGLM